MRTEFWAQHHGLTNLKQSPSCEADSRSPSQEIPRLSWNPKVHYRVHNSPPLVPTLSQMNPFHTFPSYFPKIQSNVTLPSTSRCPERPFPFRFSNQNIARVSHRFHACYTSRPSHLMKCASHEAPHYAVFSSRRDTHRRLTMSAFNIRNDMRN
jgi:hypothetical protein